MSSRYREIRPHHDLSFLVKKRVGALVSQTVGQFIEFIEFIGFIEFVEF